jgi:hypothetical protein
VEGAEVQRWFDEYLGAFAACGRGESPTTELLNFYGVPLLLSSDAGFVALATREAVVAAMQQQIDALVATRYDHSEVHALSVERINSVSAVCRGTFSRHRQDGSEISQLAARYLIAEADDGLRIRALVVQSP